MPRKKYNVDNIIRILREAEVLQNQGDTIAVACRKLGVSEQAFYRWKKQYGKMQPDQAKRLKSLEHENMRLKKLVADLSLDNAILKEVAEGNF